MLRGILWAGFALIWPLAWLWIFCYVIRDCPALGLEQPWWRDPFTATCVFVGIAGFALGYWRAGTRLIG